MKQVTITNSPKPIQLEAYRVSFDWFNQLINENEVEAEYNVEGNVVSGVSRVEVCNGGEIIALFDTSDLYVTILTKAPTEAMMLEAISVIAESGA